MEVTTARRRGPTGDVEPQARAPGGTGPQSGRPGTGNADGTPATTTPAAPTTTTTTSPPPPPVGPESTVITTGGSVTAACSGGAPRLVRAIPNAGFGVQVSGSGGQLVVNLRSSTHLSVVEIECEGTRVQFSTGEESTD